MQTLPSTTTVPDGYREWVEIFDAESCLIYVVYPDHATIVLFEAWLKRQDPAGLSAQYCTAHGGVSRHAFPIDLIVPTLRKLASLRFLQKKFDEAEKVSRWDGWIYVDGLEIDNHHGYFESVQALHEAIEEHNAVHPEAPCVMPDWVFCTETCRVKRDNAANLFAEYFEENIYEGSWDDVPQTAVDALNAALDRFYDATQGIVGYEPDWEKVLLIKSPALDVWGGQLPKRVKMLRDVTSDLPFPPFLCCHQGCIYEVELNPHGAVSARLGSNVLGLKPDEFEVVEWQ